MPRFFQAWPAESVVGQENGAARVSKRVFEIYSMQMLKYKILYARLLTRGSVRVHIPVAARSFQLDPE
jgi:hypothetical protein